MPGFNPKIALLGSGQIGGTFGLLCGLKKLSSDVHMLDVVADMPKGKALDMSQALTCEGITCHVSGCSDISENSEGLKDADIVIVTAGFPRRPGMSRDDLVQKNAEIISGVASSIKKQCPGAFVICITNPLDVMVSLLQKVSGLPPNRVVGMAGILDSSRFRYFLGTELGVSPRDISTMVLGGHGDEMVPLQSITSVAGIPLDSVIKMGWITQQRVDEIIQRTRQGGGEIVQLMKMGSAFAAPAMCAIQMVEAYIHDEKRLLPCCAHLNGEFGHSGIYAGVPVIIGKNGVEKVVEIPFRDSEKAAFEKSVEAVQNLRKACQSLGFQA